MRKQLLQKMGSLMLTGALVTGLSACSPAPAETVREEIGAPPETAGTPAEPQLSAQAREAFAALLREAHDHQVLPDGTELEAEGPEENQFALFDVDSDGELELVLLWTEASMAGMLGIVYRYNPETAAPQVELWDFPSLTFYKSGAVTAEWSHNQGMSGERFWPYTLYLYDPVTDDYQWMGTAEAWDRSQGETDGGGNPFPEEADADGDGWVYFLTTGPEDTRTLDGPDYEAWRNDCIQGTEPLEIPYQKLTEANIAAALGVPAPAAVLPESAIPEETSEETKDPAETAGPEETHEPEPAAPTPQESQEPENDGLPYGQPVNLDKSSLPAAYAAAIEAYCRAGVWPDGQEDGAIPLRVSYVVLDIDGDGRDELILQNSDTVMAAQSERIYEYRDGTFQKEFSAFPALIYYDNGVIQADWSHNQGKAGDRLWPYTLYQYQPQTDSYEILGAADGWDRTLGEHLGAYGGEFPQETDTDNDGYLYFLLPPNWAGEYTRGTLVDGPDYENWRSAFLQDAVPLRIPYQTLMVETIYPNAAG